MTRKKLTVLACVIAAALTLCACSANTSPAREDSVSYSTATQSDAYYSTATAAPTEENGSGEFTAISAGQQSSDALKLIYTANIAISSQNYESDYTAVVNAVTEAGGYVSNETSKGSKPAAYGDSGRRATLELRVPVSAYASCMQTVLSIGSVTAKTQQVSDVTDQYYDTQARIDMYELQYQKLTEHLKSATDMEDIITLEEKISDVLYKLDSIKGDMRHLENRISYCTVTVELQEVVDIADTTASPEPDSLGKRMKDSFTSAVTGTRVFFEWLLVFLSGALPVLALLAVVPVAVILIVLACNRRRARRQADKKPADASGTQTPPQAQ